MNKPFSALAKLKVESKTFVGYNGDINRYIKSFKEIIISELEQKDICEKIKNLNLKGYKVKKEHVESIHVKMEEYENKINNMICPKCGGKLILRKGQYGDFFGCSNYPKCKFKKHLNK